MKRGAALLTVLLAVATVHAAVPIGDTITLYSVGYAKYVKVDTGSGNLLNANSGSASNTTEHFVVQDAGGGKILLKALCNGLYVQLTSDVKRLKAVGTSTSDTNNQWQWVEGSGGIIHLKSVGSGDYVTPNTGGTLKANSASTNANTQFTWAVVGGGGAPGIGPRIADTLYSDFDTPVITIDAVQEFGADNTGTSNTTAQIQAALDAASNQWGGVVYLPAGTYRLGSTLNIPDNVTLRGDWKRPTDADKTVAGTVLLINHGAGTEGTFNGGADVGIVVNGQSGLRDLSIYYPQQSDPNHPVAFPYTLDFQGGLNNVRNLTLVNVYDAIYLPGVGFPTVVGIYGAPLHRGIVQGGSGSTPRMENIHFAPEYWAESGLGSVAAADVKNAMHALGGIAFIVGGGGGGAVYMGLEFSGYAIGIDSDGDQSPRLFDFDISNCSTGMYFPNTKSHGWVINKGRVDAEKCALALGENSDFLSFNSVVFASDDRLVDHAKGSLTLTRCTFERWGNGYAVDSYNMTPGSGPSTYLSVVGCDFQQANNHIRIGATVEKAVVYGNTPRGSALKVQNNAGTGENIVIDKDNVHHFISMDPIEPVEDILRIRRQVPAPPAGADHVFNVYNYGANGTGAADDTDEFQNALNAAGALATSNAGCVVYVPAGVFRINGHLNVPSNVELRGLHDGAFNDQARSIVCLFADKDLPDNPATIKLQADAGIRGLALFRPEQEWSRNGNPYDKNLEPDLWAAYNQATWDYIATNRHAYPPAVEGTDRNWAYDILLPNTYDGIVFTSGGGHDLDFIFGCSLHRLVTLGGSTNAMSTANNVQGKTSSWRQLSTEKNSYPVFQASGFGDGSPHLTSQDEGLGWIGSGMVVEGNGHFRAMGHFINQSGDGLIIIDGSPTLNMYCCGGEGAGIGVVTHSADNAAMDVEVVGNSYHTGDRYTESETSAGDRLHIINCKNYGSGATTHYFEGDGHIVVQQDYRGVIHDTDLTLKGTATGILEGGFIDSGATYSIRAFDGCQARMCGVLSSKGEYDFHSDDEARIVAESNCPNDIRGISGTGGSLKVWSAYDAWSVGWPAKIGSSTNDFDGDLLNNFGEYALGGNPIDAGDIGAVPFMVNTGGGLHYVHAMRSDDPSLIYLVETCTNLVSGGWSNAGYAVSGTNVTGLVLNYVTNTIPALQGQSYIRLKVTKP